MPIPRPTGPPAVFREGPDVRHATGGGVTRLGGWGTTPPKGLQTSISRILPVVGPRPFHGIWMSSLHPRGMGGKFRMMGRGKRHGLPPGMPGGHPGPERSHGHRGVPGMPGGHPGPERSRGKHRRRLWRHA